MIKIKCLFICIAVLILSLTACTGDVKDIDQIPPSGDESNAPTQGVADSSSENTSPKVSESSDDTLLLHQVLRDIVPSLNNVTNIAVKVPGYALDHFSDMNTTLSIYAPASEVQAREIVNYLELLDSTDFTEVEGYNDESFPFTTSTMLIENKSGSCTFHVIASESDVDNSILYIAVIPNQRPADILAGEEILPIRYFEGQPGTFPIRALNDALTDILLDTSDLQNVAVVRILDSDKPEYTLNKGDTAVWRYMFDATIRNNGPVENTEAQGYDVKIIMGDTTYFLNKTSGFFSKEYDGEIKLGKLNEDTLKWFLDRYNVYLDGKGAP
jgi:hypothetical protein